MARQWKPTRRCCACLYRQWFGCKLLRSLWSFSKTSTLCCARSLWPRHLAAPVPSLDEIAIQKRFDEFQSIFCSKPYERRKSALGQLNAPVSLTHLEKVFSKSSFWDSYPGFTPWQFAGGCLNYVLLCFRYYGTHFSVLSMTRIGWGFLSSGE